MDAQVRWLRRTMVRRLLARLAVEYLIVTDLALVALLLGRVDRTTAFVSALLIGQVVMAARVGLALTTNPVNHSYLREYAITRPEIRVVPDSDPGRPADEASDLVDRTIERFFADHNMEPRGGVETVSDSGSSMSHVFVSTDGYVVGSVTQESDRPTIITRLSDDRVVVSTHELVPPHTGLIVNRLRRATARQLLEGHVAVLERLHAAGVSPVVSGAAAAAAVLELERAAWAELGPYLGPFLAVGTRWQPTVLHTNIDSASILEQGIDGAPPERVAAALAVPARPDVPDDTAEEDVGSRTLDEAA